MTEIDYENSENRPRSIRLSDEVWEKGRERAAEDGTTMSEVLRMLAIGYANGQVNAPRQVVVYDS